MADTPAPSKPGRYDYAAVERRWQDYWARHGTFRTPNPGAPGFDTGKPKFYILDMFPYPSGAGLHVGHPLGYCATDIMARYKRMRGYNVLHPMGFDAFGLPAEQYAVETNVHPAVTTRQNIETYRRQLQMFGFSYDWERELATSAPGYYKFTQWIFLRIFESWYDPRERWTAPDGREVQGRARPISDLRARLESGEWGVDAALDVVRERGGAHRREFQTLSPEEQRRVIDRQRLAYLDEVPVNWCPALGTVLANEEVDSAGRSERGGHPVYRRPLTQWMMRITRYADRLLSDLDPLDWPEPIKLMQRNWIGRSTGANVVFPLASCWAMEGGRFVRRDGRPVSPSFLDFPDAVRVYTTRPDTLFGATYMVLAPEHDLVDRITPPQRRAEVSAYVTAARNRSDLDRAADTKEKTGVFTGACAINPVTGAEMPIWVADYVLMGYGTGAIMAVPGSDERDFAFARHYDLPIVAVVRPTERWIEERAAVLCSGVEEARETAFDEVLATHPEQREELNAARARSADLGERTLTVLRERVGTTRLIEHYLRHPAAWGAAFVDAGTAVNSPAPAVDPARVGQVCCLNGLPTPEAKRAITEWLERRGVGVFAVNYKLRDWVFSRQKYWGEPFPVLHGEDGEIVPLSDDELPLELPPMEDFKPTPAGDDAQTIPTPPLGRARDWVTVERGGARYRRDLNTMPQWAGSCWYYLRFIDPDNESRFCDARAERYWMPVDFYVGGAEHAVLHLLYARFWHKVLFDLGYVSTAEPFRKLFNQGMIQGFAFRNRRGVVLPVEEVDETGPEVYVHTPTGESVERITAKMSKSLRNVVNPDDIIAQYGADTFRLYEMYMGPLDAAKPWNTRDVPGLSRLCHRIWRLVVDEETGERSATLTDGEPDAAMLRVLHKTIRRVTEELEAFKLNTAIAAIFDFVNALTPAPRRPRRVIEPFLLLLSPFAPHLAEELWNRLGHDRSLAYEPWPACDKTLARDESIEIAVQVNGKLRSRVTVPTGADEQAHREAALADDRVRAAIKDATIRKVLVVPGRLVNIVVG
jgi:leucyl-tRNA synthetase